ncbi:MAG: insulinase family protein [Clostridia bacterium]|nr:insulinase family protein [Clostridia bacterium]
MAVAEKFNVSDNINLYVIKDKKYKTVLASTYLHRNLCREEATFNSLLSKVLKVATKKYSNLLDLSIYAEKLYGCGFDIGISKRANVQSLVSQVSFLSDRYAGENICEESLELMLDMLFDPYTIDDGFCREYVENQKKNLKDDIESLINDKRTYASVRCLEEMCKGEQNAIVEIGYKEDLDTIDETNLYNHYKSIIFSSPIDIFVVSDIDAGDILKYLKGYFGKFEFNIKPIDIVCTDKLVSNEKYVEDNMNVNQGKLAIGLRTGINIDNSLYYALLTGNSIFGSGAHSKLFNNVREKLSLCYYAYSRLDKYNGIMLIGSGIEFDKYQVTKDAIINELSAVKNGDFTNDELNIAKEYIISSFSSYEDSPGLLIDYYLGAAFSSSYPSISEVCNKVKKVTKEDIINAFSNVCVDTVYFLNGKESK